MNSSCLIFIISVIVTMIISAMGIIDGMYATNNDFNYQAAILTWDKEHICSGGIISNTHILTVASCVYDKEPSDLLIGIGKVHLEDPDMILRNVTEIDIDDEYIHVIVTPNSTSHVQFFGYDISVLTIHPALEWNNAVGRLLLPFRDFVPCDLGLFAGWGENAPGEEYHPKLQWTFQTVLAAHLCAELEIYHFADQFCTATPPGFGKPSHVRTYTERKIVGDDGAPLVIDGVVVGIADLTALEQAAGTRFINVYDHLDYISGILGI